MIIDALSLDEQVIFAATALMCSVTAAMNLATLHKTALTRFLPQEHLATKTGLVQDHSIPTPKESRSQSNHYGHRHGRYFNQSQLCCHSHHNRSSSSPRRHIRHSPSSNHSGWHHPSTDRHPQHHSHQDTCHRHSHTPSHTHHISHQHHSHHYFIDWSQSCYSNSHCIAWRHSQWGKPSHTQDLQCSIHPTIPRLSSSRTPHQISPQIQTITDSWNYYSLLPVAMKTNMEANLQLPITL